MRILAMPVAHTPRFMFAVVLAVAAVIPVTLSAQTNSPRVRVLPGNGGYARGAQVTVRIQYCSRYGLDMTTEQLTVNNVQVDYASWPQVQNTQTDCSWWNFERLGTITLVAGTNAVRARIENDPDNTPGSGDGVMGQALSTYSTPWPVNGVTAVAENRYVDAPASQPRIEWYTITNTGELSTPFTVSCSWSLGGSCTVSQSAITLAAGASAAISATVTTGAVGLAGILTFSVTGGVGPLPASASTWTEITGVAVTSATRGVTLVNPSGLTERDLCLTIAAGNGTAYECGDLRLAHALPSIRTRGKLRTPTLIYNSALAQPTVSIPAHLALGTGFSSSDTITAIVIITSGPYNGTVYSQAGKWKASDWTAAGESRRIVATFDGSSMSTGRFSYRLEIRRSSGGQVDYADGWVNHVNRSSSPFHGGWWIAGLERLYFPATGGVLWVGGDGSTRHFDTREGACDWKASENLDRPEFLRSDCTTYFTRELPNGLKVIFSTDGLHHYTVNRLGDTTTFAYNGDQTLAWIWVPPRNGPSPAVYFFYYNAASGLLDSVSAPPLSSSVLRMVRLTWVLGPQTDRPYQGGRLTRFQDPDTTYVHFHYADETPGWGDYRINKRVDRRFVYTTLTYGTGNRLVSVSTPASPTQTVVQTFRSAEAQGIGAYPLAVAGRAILPESVYTTLDGSRTDVADVTKWWLNRFGSPVRVRNAVGVETKITYDAIWPALAASVRSGSGLTTSAWFNVRGLTDSVKVMNPYGDGQNAKTRYRWNAYWDMPDTIEAPTGEVTTRGYDGNGNVLWTLTGADTLRKVRFSYSSTRQLVAMYLPGIARPDTIMYDHMGNDTMTVTPAGIWSISRLDALGRDTLVVSPIDSIRLQSQRIIYDLADQVRETRTFAPAMPYTLAGTGSEYQDTAVVLPETLVVRTRYDQEGNVIRVQKLAYPNPRPWIFDCTNTAGQCEGVTAADTGSVDIRTYDDAGRLTSQRLGSGAGILKYDLAGNVIGRIPWSVSLPPSATSFPIEHKYDAANRLTVTVTKAKTHAPELCENHAAGPLGGDPCLMRFPVYPNSGTDLLIVADTARFLYDAAGNQRGAYNALTRIDRGFYATGDITSDKLTLRDYSGSGSNTSYQLDYKYDLSGRRKTMHTPWVEDSIRYGYDPGLGVLTDVWHGQSRLRFTYDRAGRQDSLIVSKLPSGGAETIGVRERRIYDDDGQLIKRSRSSTSFGNLITDTIGYDRRGKMQYVWTQSRAAEVGTLEYHNRYSGLGAVVAQQRYQATTIWDIEEFRTTAMGDVYRSKAYRSSGVNKFPTISFYNQLGALTRKQPVRENVDGAAFYRDTTYAHVDDDGHVLRTGTVYRGLYESSPYDQTASRSYFGHDGRLRYQQRNATYSGPNGGSWEEYWYDALGRKVLTRARRDSLCSGMSAGCSSYIERTLWDGDQILYELRGEGSDTATAGQLNTAISYSPYDYGKVGYVHAGGIDAPLLLMDGRVPNYNWRGLPESSVWADGTAADCSVASEGSGCTTIAWPGNSGVYMLPILRAYGATRPTWVGSLLNNGVGSTGMAYRRNRFYDGATGQFNQQDPIGLAGGSNTYGFTGGDPINYTDPFGLCVAVVDCPVTIGAGIVGGKVLFVAGAAAVAAGSLYAASKWEEIKKKVGRLVVTGGIVIGAILTDGATAKAQAGVERARVEMERRKREQEEERRRREKDEKERGEGNPDPDP